VTESGDHPLEAEIKRLIRVAGPMPVADYMARCLMHPAHGYYATRDPLGEAGDFTTAPEISQMFGELIGLWAAAVWRMMGEPKRINIVELGPGRGTMMADALRAAKVVPNFDAAITVHLVETSPSLRERQRQKLGEFGKTIAWHTSLRDVPTSPAIYLANEFFDALPVNQAVRQIDGWHTRAIVLDEHGHLRFGLVAEPLRSFEQTLPLAVRNAPLGSIFEWRSHHTALELGRRVADGAAALILDYGHVRSAVGDTFQAVRNHRFDDPLAAPGRADLTAHVDFEALAAAADTMGATIFGPIEQATFLRRLGIEQRAEKLKAKASPAAARAVSDALNRLTSETATGMGRLFKVLGLAHDKLAGLPGFDQKVRAEDAAPVPAGQEG
jgi:SAM-dependent MidA family methyltransferase